MLPADGIVRPKVRILEAEQDAMILGIVTNCFQHQLQAGASLVDLIAEAERRGYRAVELRQGSLGEFETTDGLPDANSLTELPRRFPNVRFNVAMQFPFLGAGCDPHAPVFSTGKWAAEAVAGEAPPHLRLVDLTTTDEEFEDNDPLELANRLEILIDAMAEIDGVLSIENGPQRWDVFKRVFDAAREKTGPDAHRLMLCYDPCNLLARDDNPEPAEATISLSGDDLSMIHFKQRSGGVVQPAVGDGDVNWSTQQAALEEIGYAGPALFEVASGAQLWEALERSEAYLRDCGFTW